MAIVFPHTPIPVVWFAHRSPDAPTVRRQRIGHWTLEITHDPFTQRTTCRLYARAITYGRTAMAFSFSPWVNTYDAVYRIDDGPAYSWRVNAMALASTGVVLQTDDLINPSGGRVFAPTAALLGARTITIRPAWNAPTRVFKLADLPAAIYAARAADCGPDFDVGTGG